MDKVPKRANKAIGLLEDLVNQLHYFYGNNDTKFRKHVLPHAVEIENILKDLSINKKETFKRIARSYENYYRNKQDAVNVAIDNADEKSLNDSLRTIYNKEKQ